MEIGAHADETVGGDVADTAIADVQTFTRAYEHYRLPVYRYLRAHGATDADALDLTAVTFERAWAARHSFRPRGGGLAAWLFRIARNASIDAHRQHGRGAHATPEEVELAASAGELEPDHVALRDAVARLPEPQRDAVWLRFAAGFTAREIGMVLGKSEAAVQKQIQRALDALGEALQ